TDTAREWFQGKNVVDIGCGSGRFTYGLLKLGANVLACDQSSAGLERTEQLCHDFSDRLQTQRIDLLQWDESGEFDMAFSFGVVHHTGNTYRAIQNVCRKVKSGGKLFMMVYGFPLSLSDFGEVVAYEKIRNELAEQSFQQRKNTLIKLHGERLAHGWFDAVSPTINDLLTYAELVQLLSHLGFTNIRKTLDNRNHHLRADKSL
ncbi:MAG: class I SAM-dependent methyltransferase, partial [Chloroflexi bacterium]|nr:class I SAM-dependent methyltransferase [Chloroflexota bacterium]